MGKVRHLQNNMSLWEVPAHVEFGQGGQDGHRKLSCCRSQMPASLTQKLRISAPVLCCTKIPKPRRCQELWWYSDTATGQRMRLKALIMFTKERHELYWGKGKLEWVGKKLFPINTTQDTKLRGGIVHQ